MVEDSIEEMKRLSDHPNNLETIYALAKMAAEQTADGAWFVETGTRSGGSALITLKAIKDSGRKHFLLTIDPYGELDYMGAKLDYGDHRYREAMYHITKYAYEWNLNHIHLKMKSQEVVQIAKAGGLNFYSNNERVFPPREWIQNDGTADAYPVYEQAFAFVYLDGDHSPETVEEELSYFKNHMYPTGYIVIDDPRFYEHVPERNDLPVLKEFMSKAENDGERLIGK